MRPLFKFLIILIIICLFVGAFYVLRLDNKNSDLMILIMKIIDIALIIN